MWPRGGVVRIRVAGFAALLRLQNNGEGGGDQSRVLYGRAGEVVEVLETEERKTGEAVETKGTGEGVE
jgi:hypothetical protein